MADRNPSKQRRQAQNRAAREARAARSQAANTPVEDRRVEVEEDKSSSRRRRARKNQEDVKARAREVIESSAEEAIEPAHSGDAPDVGARQVAQSAVRRGSSPVFSSRHRAQVALATADAAPARTHLGVVDATGVAEIAPVRRPQAGSATRAARTQTSKNPDRNVGRSHSPSAASRSTSTTGRAPASRSTNRPARPPAKPLPGFLDRFGGNEPGGRMVMLSFATVLVASIVLNFVHIVPEIVTNAKGKQVQTGEYFTIWHYGVGPGLYFLLPPIVILGLFILTARPWDRRRSWNIALACLVFITFVTQSIAIYIIPIACLGWGCWQARKAALEEVGGDPRVLREVEKERRTEGREALRAMRAKRGSRN